MISSCSDCKTKCCRTGPGPYEAVPPLQYLEDFEHTENYNKVCDNFDLETERCLVWGTYLLPIQCRIYVCHLRTYAELELLEIKAIADVNFRDE